MHNKALQTLGKPNGISCLYLCEKHSLKYDTIHMSDKYWEHTHSCIKRHNKHLENPTVFHVYTCATNILQQFIFEPPSKSFERINVVKLSLVEPLEKQIHFTYDCPPCPRPKLLLLQHHHLQRLSVLTFVYMNIGWTGTNKLSHFLNKSRPPH